MRCTRSILVAEGGGAFVSDCAGSCVPPSMNVNLVNSPIRGCETTIPRSMTYYILYKFCIPSDFFFFEKIGGFHES